MPITAFSGTDRFELIRRLGEGGFGIVYEALDRKRAARVALKVLREAEGTNLYRFKREFRSLWTVRINAACRNLGLNYSRFIAGLKAAEVEVDDEMTGLFGDAEMKKAAASIETFLQRRFDTKNKKTLKPPRPRVVGSHVSCLFTNPKPSRAGAVVGARIVKKPVTSLFVVSYL